jgi:hypothetical protein
MSESLVPFWSCRSSVQPSVLVRGDREVLFAPGAGQTPGALPNHAPTVAA